MARYLITETAPSGVGTFTYDCDTLEACANKILQEMRYNENYDYRRGTTFKVEERISELREVPFNIETSPRVVFNT